MWLLTQPACLAPRRLGGARGGGRTGWRPWFPPCGLVRRLGGYSEWLARQRRHRTREPGQGQGQSTAPSGHEGRAGPWHQRTQVLRQIGWRGNPFLDVKLHDPTWARERWALAAAAGAEECLRAGASGGVDAAVGGEEEAQEAEDG
jgi:hypothetical protein